MIFQTVINREEEKVQKPKWRILHNDFRAHIAHELQSEMDQENGVRKKREGQKRNLMRMREISTRIWVYLVIVVYFTPKVLITFLIHTQKSEVNSGIFLPLVSLRFPCRLFSSLLLRWRKNKGGIAFLSVSQPISQLWILNINENDSNHGVWEREGALEIMMMVFRQKILSFIPG